MSTKVLFNVDEDEVLVEMVEKFPPLYDLQCPTYKIQTIKDSAWREIAEAVERSVDDCKKRWRNIKDTYHKRKKKGTGTGSSASNVPKKWKLADMLSFLDATDHTRGTISNINSAKPSAQTDVEREAELCVNHSASNDEDIIVNIDDDEASQIELDSRQTPSAASESLQEPRRRKRQKTDKILGLLEDRRKEREGILKMLGPNREDDVDLFFKSIAMSVKQLNPT